MIYHHYRQPVIGHSLSSLRHSSQYWANVIQVYFWHLRAISVHYSFHYKPAIYLISLTHRTITVNTDKCTYMLKNANPIFMFPSKQHYTKIKLFLKPRGRLKHISYFNSTTRRQFVGFLTKITYLLGRFRDSASGARIVPFSDCN